MQRSGARPQEVALPAAALAAFRRTLAGELGGDPAARALQQAGCAAGRVLLPGLGIGQAEPGTMPAAEIFARLDRLLAARGWGRLRHDAVHEGVGELVADTWLEAGTAGSAARPSCFFTCGLLAALLTGVAGQEMAVLEVACRSAGADRCRFCFGAPATLEALHRRILSGQDADTALAALR